MRNKHVGFVVEQELHDQLRATARDEGRSVSNLLYVIVKKWLKKHSLKKQERAQGQR